MDNVSSAHRARKTTIPARVPRDFAAALAELVDQGNRSVSREVCGAPDAEECERGLLDAFDAAYGQLSDTAD